MKNRILDNWILKLASVVIAVALWIVALVINDPADSRRMTNVPVTFINTEVITENGKVFEVLDGTDTIRSITINATRSVIDDLEDKDIRVEADFSKMKLDNTVEIKFYSDRHNDSITFRPSSSELKLSVENKTERYYSLEVELIGEPKDGYIIGNSKLDKNRISVSGAASRVKNVDRAIAVVDITDTSGDIFTYADIVLLDDNGDEISREHLDVNMKTVGTTVEILKTKTVPVIYESEGLAAEGYVTTGEVTGEVSELMIAGKENLVSAITEIKVAGEELYFEDAEEDVVVEVDLDDYLPDGIIRADKQGNGRTNVTVQIAPIIDKEYTIETGRIRIENIPEGYSVKPVLASAEVVVTVRGSKHLIDGLSAADLTGTFDVAAWMQERGMSRLGREEVYKVDPAYELGEGLEVTATTPIEIISNVLED